MSSSFLESVLGSLTAILKTFPIAKCKEFIETTV